MVSIELTEVQVKGLMQVFDVALKEEDFNALDAVVIFASRVEQELIKLVEEKKTNPKAAKITISLANEENNNELQAFMAILKIGLNKLGLSIAGLVMLIKQQVEKQLVAAQAETNEPKPEEPKGAE